MRVSDQEAQRSHGRILQGAARLMRERGIESTSVQDVMGAAGMQHGGFYRHFESKEALVDSALQLALDQVVAGLERRLRDVGPDKALTAFRRQYLSDEHVNSPGAGCPVAALAGDVGHASEELKSSFGAGVNRVIETLARKVDGTPSARRKRALREFALAVGAVVIARACDEETRRDVLSACRETALDRLPP